MIAMIKKLVPDMKTTKIEGGLDMSNLTLKEIVQELDAIRDYVENEGGGLLVLGAYTGDWHHEANLNQLIRRYGMLFNNDLVMPERERTSASHCRAQV